jgi:hypothetical protein
MNPVVPTTTVAASETSAEPAAGETRPVAALSVITFATVRPLASMPPTMYTVVPNGIAAA